MRVGGDAKDLLEARNLIAFNSSRVRLHAPSWPPAAASTMWDYRVTENP